MKTELNYSKFFYFFSHTFKSFPQRSNEHKASILFQDWFSYCNLFVNNTTVVCYTCPYKPLEHLDNKYYYFCDLICGQYLMVCCCCFGFFVKFKNNKLLKFWIMNFSREKIISHHKKYCYYCRKMNLVKMNIWFRS